MGNSYMHTFALGGTVIVATLLLVSLLRGSEPSQKWVNSTIRFSTEATTKQNSRSVSDLTSDSRGARLEGRRVDGLPESSAYTKSDLSGTWDLTMDPDFRGDRGIVVSCLLTHNQPRLTVRCGKGSMMEGQINDRIATWQTSRNTEERPFAVFTAEVDQSGGRLSGHWDLRLTTDSLSGKFSAQKRLHD